MASFDFVSVFTSIIFGLGLAQLLTGALTQVFRERLGFVQAAYTILALLLIVLSWWGLVAWKDDETWTLAQFLVLVVWALALFGLCVSLFPPAAAGDSSFESRRKAFLLILATACLLDVLQSAMHGAIFTPWYYLPYIAHYAALAVIAVYVRNRVFQSVVAVYFPMSMFFWGFVWTSGLLQG